ncbi:MAG: hypothetical protein HC784_14715, partial [Hydrococcus sp. CSU_1_8]|nr:hypothetical protein [Hydrococcus sp. CSU_1_8]
MFQKSQVLDSPRKAYRQGKFLNYSASHYHSPMAIGVAVGLSCCSHSWSELCAVTVGRRIGWD